MSMECGTAPVRWWALDDWGQPLHDMRLLPRPDAPEWEAKYDNDVERGKLTLRDPWHMPLEAERAVGRMRHYSFVDWWHDRLGYRVWDDPLLHGGGLHAMRPGGVLGTHLDYSRHPLRLKDRRALNLICFLNPEWRDEWGGALVLCDPMGRVVQRIHPRPGRLVAFEVGDLSYHGVERVADDAPPRVTAAVYYLSDATPADTRVRAMFLPYRGAM